MKELEQKLYEKGLYAFNMTGIYNDEYEVYDGEGNIIADHLDLDRLNEFCNSL